MAYNCNHCWGNQVYKGTKIEYIPRSFKQVKQGSDIWTEAESCEKQEVSAQYVVCIYCGERKYL